MGDRVETPAGRALAAAGVDHVTADVTGARSAEEAAALQGLATGQLVKTLVLRRSEDEYLFVLVPGDRVIDWPKLRAHLGVSRVSLPEADEAREATGYERGTITPFGARVAWPVVADATIAGAGTVGLGSGVRGTAVQLDADVLLTALDAEVAEVTRPG